MAGGQIPPEGKCGFSMTRSAIVSPFIDFSRLHSGSRFNLASSAIEACALAELPVTLEQLEITGPSTYGYGPLVERLAARNHVSRECVVYVSGGASLANNLALAATTEPGDHVLIETPGYELLDSAARFLGLDVGHFERRWEEAFRLDLAEIAAHLTTRTRLIVVTNLHNPSGVLVPQDTLRALGELARGARARVLVDEAYLDMALEKAPPSSFHLDHEIFVVTSSLTKAYGLGGLRCGWVLAEPELAQRLWRLTDLYAGTPVHVAERLSVVALDHLPALAARAKSLLEANRPLLKRFLDSCSAVEAVWPAFGAIAFPRLRHGAVEELFQRLRDKYETSVVPGVYFSMPRHFRVGIGGPTSMVGEGLERLASAISE
jgi:aspartate/methionine/tyrosine aminotransferase